MGSNPTCSATIKTILERISIAGMRFFIWWTEGAAVLILLPTPTLLRWQDTNSKGRVIMGRFGLKINKLMQALESQGEIYMLDRRQVWSDKLHKKVQSLTLSKSVPTEEYNENNPKPKSTQHERVKVVELTTFSEVEIVLALAAKWKQVTRNGRRVKSNTC